MAEPRSTDLEQDLLQIVQELSATWDREDDEEITPSTPLVGALGMDSLAVVALIQRIEQRYREPNLPFQAFFVEQRRFIDDFTIRDLAGFLRRHLQCAGQAHG